MTQFTEAFYKAYYETHKDLEVAKQEWKALAERLRVDAEIFQKLTLSHDSVVQLYERLVQLEKIWGVYCVSYTEAVSERDKAYAEDDGIRELANITKEQR